MNPVLAGGLVFFTSGAVLVLEILAVRLVAPYVGVTLETYTAIIGTMLAGIAFGTWCGGYAADRAEPRRLLGPLLVAGGVMAMASVPLVRYAGDRLSGGTGLSVIGLAFVAFFLPAAVLSAVSPTVVKLQLRDLGATGRVVGRLSALGTAGAILGTFLAGFVLIELAPTSTTVLVVGGLFVVAGLALGIGLAPGTGRRAVSPVVVVLALVGSGVAVVAAGAGGDRCQTETTYHCVRVEPDPRRAGGRLLVLDTLHHSYVDLDNPTYLEFRYARVFADAIGAVAPADGPLDVLHIGGGGFTFPRWVRAVRPGSSSVVLEIDPGLVTVAVERLGLVTEPGIDVRTGDARTLMDGLDPGRFDVALGDAFGGLAVPWHLTTVEFVRSVKSRLRSGGAYVLNVIDWPPARFARAEVATLAAVFDHVAMVVPPSYAEGDQGGNFVLVASDRPIDGAAITRAVGARQGGEVVVEGPQLRDFTAGAPVLTDDQAPVDQWLARARRDG